MNDRTSPTGSSSWPPPGLAQEQGNDDKTVVTVVSEKLLQKLVDSGPFMIDSPAPGDEESPRE